MELPQDDLWVSPPFPDIGQVLQPMPWTPPQCPDPMISTDVAGSRSSDSKGENRRSGPEDVQAVQDPFDASLGALAETWADALQFPVCGICKDQTVTVRCVAESTS
jgi:hypothetical protein